MKDETKERARRRLGDESGAVMVLGIFMCTCLVGALWYLAGIGDAIVYRQRMQEAADATAYSGAVLHARGMNLLVLINLLMAMVLAVRVALKVLQLVLIVVTVAVAICAALFFSPVSAAICNGALPFLEEANTTVEQLIEDTRDPINEMLELLHNAETVIADVVPLATVAGGKQVADTYRPPLTDSLTNVPIPPSFTKLPVQNGTTDRLCVEAADAVGQLVGELIKLFVGDGLGMVGDWISSPLTALAKASPGYFCELGGAGGPPDLSSMLDQTAKDKCNDELDLKRHVLADANAEWHTKCRELGVVCVDPFFDGFQDRQADMPNFFDVRLTRDERESLLGLKQSRDIAQADVDAFRFNQCVSDQKRQLQQSVNQANAKQQANGTGSGSGKEPMMVASNWQNGDALGQVLAAVEGNGTLLNRGPKGVRVGALQDRRAPRTIRPPVDANRSYAQAEFFYDCAGAWKDNSCNGGGLGLKDNEEAMWHFRWRARLRRYNAPVPLFDALVFSDMLFHSGDLATKAFLPPYPRGFVAKGRNGALRAEILGGPQSLELH